MRKENTYHHGDLRADLLKAARKRLAKDGYEVLSLRELARDIGVSASAPYAHFKSRDELFSSLIGDGARSLAGLFEEAAAVPEASPAQRLAAACRAYLGFAQRKRELFRLMFASPVAPSDEFEGEVRRTLDQFDALVAAVLDAEDGALVKATAMACWSMMHGYAMLRLHRRLQLPAMDETGEDVIVDALLHQAEPRS